MFEQNQCFLLFFFLLRIRFDVDDITNITCFFPLTNITPPDNSEGQRNYAAQFTPSLAGFEAETTPHLAFIPSLARMALRVVFRLRRRCNGLSLITRRRNGGEPRCAPSRRVF